MADRTSNQMRSARMENANCNDEISVSYPGIATWIHRVTEPAIRSAIRALELPPGSRGLDAGCGVGTHTLWLAEATSPDGYVTGIDISPGCLTVCDD
jgi:ubiquinone/menaquinone biosynthesis C-methylase UbiE